MDEIKDISFVIITYNEEFGIRKCLDSIESLNKVNCEVICIDSGSTDGTVEIIKQYSDKIEHIQLYGVSGYSNAAIGRNVGIKYSSKKYIYFIDGDIALNYQFITESLKLIRDNDADAVTGRLAEIQYDEQYSKVLNIIEDRFHINEHKRVRISGGCFIVKKAIVDEIGYFNEKLVMNEDIDFSLRISRLYEFISIPVSMGTHHTVAYENSSRIMKGFFSKNRYYGKVVLSNIFHVPSLMALLRRYSGITFGWIVYFTAILFSFYDASTAVKFFIIVLILDCIAGVLKGKSVVYRIYNHYVSSFVSVISIFVPLPNHGIISSVNKVEL